MAANIYRLTDIDTGQVYEGAIRHLQKVLDIGITADEVWKANKNGFIYRGKYNVEVVGNIACHTKSTKVSKKNKINKKINVALEDTNRAAKAAGMSYGQYQAFLLQQQKAGLC